MAYQNWVVIPLNNYLFAIHSNRIDKDLPDALQLDQTDDLSFYIENEVGKDDNLLIVGQSRSEDETQIKAWTQAAGEIYLEFLHNFAPFMVLKNLFWDEILGTKWLRKVVFSDDGYFFENGCIPENEQWITVEGNVVTEEVMLEFSEKSFSEEMPGLHVLITALSSEDKTIWVNANDIPFLTK
jgi:hypothetical protein